MSYLCRKPWFSNHAEEEDSYKFWTIERAKDFQKAVEKRTFSLYEKFYSDLEIDQLTNVFVNALESLEKNA